MQWKFKNGSAGIVIVRVVDKAELMNWNESTMISDCTEDGFH